MATIRGYCWRRRSAATPCSLPAAGLFLLSGAAVLAGPFGVPAWLLAATGAGLIGFAGLLLWILAHPVRLAPGGCAVLAADVAWIAGAMLLLVGFPSMLTTTGSTALAAATGIVAVLAGVQGTGCDGSGAVLRPAPAEPRWARSG